MKKIINLLAFVLLTGVVFVSCEKDDNSEPKEKKLVPIKISEYEDNVLDGEIVIEYNENDKVIKTDNGDGYYETYEYSAEGNLVTANIYEENVLIGYNTFEYNSSNQLIKINYLNTNDEVQTYYIHEYDNNGNVIKKTQYGTNDAIVLYFTYEHDSYGNMISEKYYWADYQTGLISTDEYDETTYEYDDKNNIFKSVDTPFLWETRINNVIVEINTEHYGNNYTVTYNYDYLYNEDNYPVEYSTDNEKHVIEYKEI